ncbi:chemotaxis protein CheW [Leptospira ilyithenensis]|uniref:Chemotaxis protein CheW n=1 Tax=Leptospira ilyithenensis TaxID=2484901 RepID=A0A4R9LPG0_9LEPT|nr:chemotaxis protein CheW [Leptospira ilyithenensis]TGN08061.1 chemotaxis protein CheW [Leptospira ilyithenensis]
MTEISDWLLFEMRDRQFAVGAQVVREILWLLPLTPTTMGGAGFFATFPLRGEIVPVLDPFFYWGTKPSPYETSYQLLLLNSGTAIPIMKVSEVISWENPKRKSDPDSSGVWEERVWKNKVVTLLDVDHFYPGGKKDFDLTEDEVQGSDSEPEKSWDEFFIKGEERAKLAWYEESYGKIHEDEISELEFRAISYADSLTPIDHGGLEPISIVKVADESYGISLDCVLEFSDPSHLTPVPGMSPILKGCMNLRGEVLPVLGLDEILGNQIKKPFGFGKVVIIKSETSQFGLLVDELVDVVYKKEDEKRTPPLGTKDYGGVLESSYQHGNGFINLLSIPTILKKIKQELS